MYMDVVSVLAAISFPKWDNKAESKSPLHFHDLGKHGPRNLVRHHSYESFTAPQ